MIVDTSALVAVLVREPGHEALLAALLEEPAVLPAPARLEFLTVARGDRFGLGEKAEALLDRLAAIGLETLAWSAEHASIAGDAQIAFGKGNGRGGTLNLLDLMVYAVAVSRGEPLLFTGRDFVATDVQVHPASRTT